MRFKRRLSGPSASQSRRSWKLYWQHLDKFGFTADDPVYRIFAGEVFHDGKIRIKNIDLINRSVTMVFRNVHAVNMVWAHLSTRSNKRPHVRRSDFQTCITFHDVKMIKISGDYKIIGDQAYYEAAELGKKGKEVSIEIVFRMGLEEGTVRCVFGSVEIEDIRRMIRKYVGKKEDVSKYVTWVCQDPKYYLTSPKSIFGK